jgi:putative two-component system response regulator
MAEAGKKRILVVDDEPQNIRILREILKASYLVLAATDGTQALALAKTAPPDLILLDIMMPGIDGYEVVRRLKSEPRTAAIPVVFVTAKGGIDDKLTGYALGGSDYVTKPLDPPFVLQVVRQRLAESTGTAP